MIMFDQWQHPLDVPALIRQGTTLKGVVQVGELSRLQDTVLEDAPVEFSLSFGRDTEGRAMIRGRVRASLELTCQRCLNRVTFVLDAEVALGVVASEAEAKALPAEFDPLILGDDPVQLAELIEDEILLALPVVPMHAHLCVPAHREHEGMEKADNPFAALRGRVIPSTH